MYVIQWKSKTNGRAGKGTKQFELEEGQRLVQELNHEYPQIQHELVESSGPQTLTPTEPVSAIKQPGSEETSESEPKEAAHGNTSHPLQPAHAS